MPNTLIRIARHHERAAECIKLANASFDEAMEARYRLLAERHIKLAECEEALEQQVQNITWRIHGPDRPLLPRYRDRDRLHPIPYLHYRFCFGAKVR